MAAVAVSTAVVVVDITGRAQRVHTMVAAGVVAITAVDTTVVAITVAAITVGVITVVTVGVVAGAIPDGASASESALAGEDMVAGEDTGPRIRTRIRTMDMRPHALRITPVIRITRTHPRTTLR